MFKFKQLVKKKMLATPKGAWLFSAFKRDGMRGVVFEVMLTTFIKIGLGHHFKIRKQAFFLYRGSRHLNFFEKFLAAEKDITATSSSGKQLLKKGILPLEKI